PVVVSSPFLDDLSCLLTCSYDGKNNQLAAITARCVARHLCHLTHLDADRWQNHPRPHSKNESLLECGHANYATGPFDAVVKAWRSNIFDGIRPCGSPARYSMRRRHSRVHSAPAANGCSLLSGCDGDIAPDGPGSHNLADGGGSPES